MPGVVDPELYTRWLQFGVFSPILRTHTTKNPDAERRIWAYPEPYSDIMRGIFHQRYAMLPYIYTEARRTYDTGVAFLHPLYYDWPQRRRGLHQQERIHVRREDDRRPGGRAGRQGHGPGAGVSLAAAGRLDRSGRRARTSQGPATVKRNFSIRQMPVYVRAGAIVPDGAAHAVLQPEAARPADRERVSRSQDGQTSTYTLYEDAGDTRAYQRDEAARTEISSSEKGGELTIVIAAVKGSYKGSYKGMPTRAAYEIRLPGDWPPLR